MRKLWASGLLARVRPFVEHTIIDVQHVDDSDVVVMLDATEALLPGRVPVPRDTSRALLARLAAREVGCVAVRPLEPAVAELKRLYVRPQARGAGVARALACAALAHARSAGYRRIVLDTLPSMAAAQLLYESLGFRESVPHAANPIAGTRFMALELAG